MNIKRLLKTIVHAVMTVFVAKQANAYDEQLLHNMAYDIGCPQLPNERMDQKYLAPVSSDFLESYGLRGWNDTAIIGNSEWTLTPYSWSSSEKPNMLRNGLYYYSKSGYAYDQACLFFSKDPLVLNPIEMECYYGFYKNPEYKAREGIDDFSLKTKLNGKVFMRNDRSIALSNTGYKLKIGSSAYDPNPVMCGGLYQIPYKENALACTGNYLKKECNIISFSKTISNKNNISAIDDAEQKENETQQKETTNISSFFNESKSCNCNCNCNCNVKMVYNETKEKQNNGKTKLRSSFCSIL